MKAFISYSHKDSAYLDKLHAHLSTLRREGKISAWFDRAILAGDNLDPTIMKELESCELFLALVSPDFLNSNYCYETEMKRALTLHTDGKNRIIPIIVEPCDWHNTPLGALKAVPKDGRPVAEWQNQNNAFLDVVTELRRIVTSAPTVNTTSHQMLTKTTASASPASRYKVKKDFDDIDYQDFRNSVYKQIRDYVEASIQEINQLDEIKARFSDINSYSFTCSILNKSKENGLAHITVHARSRIHGMGDIYYSFQEAASENTAHGGFNIESDDYELFLKKGFMSFSSTSERVTAHQAAQIIWDELLKHAGITYSQQ